MAHTTAAQGPFRSEFRTVDVSRDLYEALYELQSLLDQASSSREDMVLGPRTCDSFANELGLLITAWQTSQQQRDGFIDSLGRETQPPTLAVAS